MKTRKETPYEKSYPIRIAFWVRGGGHCLGKWMLTNERDFAIIDFTSVKSGNNKRDHSEV